MAMTGAASMSSVPAAVVDQELSEKAHEIVTADKARLTLLKEGQDNGAGLV